MNSVEFQECWTSLLASSNLSSHLCSIHICIHGILHTWPYPTGWQSATCSLHKHIGKIWQDGKSNVGFARRLAARCTQSLRHSWKVNSVTVNDLIKDICTSILTTWKWSCVLVAVVFHYLCISCITCNLLQHLNQ